MLHLQDWFQQFQFHPWHSNQLTNQQLKLTSVANSLVYEYGWQNANRAGRYDIRQAIRQSSDMFAKYAGFYPTKHFAHAYVPYPRLGDYRLWNFTPSDIYGLYVGLQLPEGHVHALGYERYSGTSTEPVVYSDLDNDGIYETATVTWSVPTGTQESEVHVAFDSSDVLYTDQDRLYDVKPRSVSIAAGVATIVIDSYQLVAPIKYTQPITTSFDPAIMPPNALSPYVSNLVISRRYCDAEGTTLDTAQAVLIWDSAPFPVWAYPWSIVDPVADPSEKRYAIARGGVRDAVNGIVYVGESVYDAVNGTWAGLPNFSEVRPPDRVLVRYYAGQSSTYLDTAIGRLSAAELNRPICAAEEANRQLANWQYDIARTGAADELYAQPNDFGNPLGSRRGHIYAWRVIQQLQRTVGILAG